MINKKIKNSLSIFILLVSDIATIFISLVLAHFLRNYLNYFIEEQYIDEFNKYIFLIWIYFIIIIFFIYEGIYIQRYGFWQEIKKIYKAIIFAFLIVFSFLALSQSVIEYSRTLISISFILMFLSFPIVKLFIKKLLFSLSFWQKNIFFIGNSSEEKQLKKFLKDNWYLGYIFSNQSSDTVFILNQNLINTLLLKYREILFLSNFKNINFTTNIISIKNNLLLTYNVFFKQLFEFILILFLLPFITLISIIIIILIKFDSNGNIFFKQNRIGKNGETFKCLKFRTMFINNDTILEKYLKENSKAKDVWDNYHKLPNDPRVTRVGKFLRKYSFDELPQVINILKGEMSLIGPRPYMLSEKEKIGKDLHIIKAVNGGITGLWQVSGRNSLTFKERVSLDVWYVKNWSLWLDFVILLKTFKVVFKDKGIL